MLHPRRQPKDLTPGRPARWRARHRVASTLVAGGLVVCGLTLGDALPATAAVVGARAVSARASRPVTITVTKTRYGKVLTERGFVLYRFTRDKRDKSVCTGACAVAWPPVLLGKGHTKPVGKDVSSLGVIRRAGGARQVTYKGIPLYRYSGDAKPGQINGEGAQKRWYVVDPASPHSIPEAASSKSGRSKTAGTGGAISY